MNKKSLVLVPMISAVMTGSSRYRDIEPVDLVVHDIPEDVIVASIVTAGERARWTACRQGPNELQLFLNFKRWLITVDATYSTNGYRLLVNPQMTTLINDDNEVHRNVNNLVVRLDRRIQNQIPIFMRSSAPKIDLKPCESHYHQAKMKAMKP